MHWIKLRKPISYRNFCRTLVHIERVKTVVSLCSIHHLYIVAAKIVVFVAPACSRVRYRRPLFRPSVRLSTFMSTFDIYVKVSILINYKTNQPSNLAWDISLTSWLCDIGVHFSVRLSVRQHLCRSSTFMSKLVFLSTTRLNNHQTLHDTSPWPPDFAT